MFAIAASDLILNAVFVAVAGIAIWLVGHTVEKDVEAVGHVIEKTLGPGGIPGALKPIFDPAVLIAAVVGIFLIVRLRKGKK